MKVIGSLILLKIIYRNKFTTVRTGRFLVWFVYPDVGFSGSEAILSHAKVLVQSMKRFENPTYDLYAYLSQLQLDAKQRIFRFSFKPSNDFEDDLDFNSKGNFQF